MEGQAMKKPISLGIDPEKIGQEEKQVEQDDDTEIVVNQNGSCINEEEERKVDCMRKLVEKHDPSVKEVDNATLRRFLRARDQDTEKGSAMFVKYLKWKQTFMPKGYISESEISNHLAQNKQFLQGFDKRGRPISVVFGGRHFPSKIPGGGVEELKRFLVFALGKICSRMPGGQEQFVMIADLEGWGYCNSDIRSSIAALTILQDYYPERLGKLLIVHVPYIFMTVWKLVYPFIDNNTKKKEAINVLMEQTSGFSSEETMRKQAEEAEISIKYDSNNDKVEKSKVDAMRNFAEKHDPSAKDADNLTLRRFLRARDHDVEKASNMFLKYLAWKRSFIPNGHISINEIQNEIAQKKQFMQGFDKQGRPITVLLGCKHFQNKKGGVDELKRFAVFALEKLCSRMPTGQEKFVVIADLKGWGYSNCDVRGMLGCLSILQDYYPERLGKLYIVHVPYVFMKAWKIVYPFIDNNTKKKIVFVENKQLKATLLEDIEESQLPQTYGGKLPLIPIQES